MTDRYVSGSSPASSSGDLAALHARYPEVERFAALMLAELAANSGKGDRAGWLAASPRALLHDITWHWAKLARSLSALENDVGHKAWRHHADEVCEYAADVANMAMMLLDRLGLLPDPRRCICGPDYMGEAPDMRDDCPQHGADADRGPFTTEAAF